MTYFNPLDKFYKSQIGAIKSQTKITFRVKGDFDSVVFVCRNDETNVVIRQPMTFIDGAFTVSLEFEHGLYWYYFDLCNGEFIGLGGDYSGIVTSNPENFQLSVFESEYQVPEWLKGGLIYQIFPDRFFSYDKNKTIGEGKILHEKWGETPIYRPNEKGKIINNDFFGGDFKGIIEKLPYIKSLGTTVIYLNPIFKAYSNHRYDTGNYMEVDPLLGTEEDFKLLINKASDCGIKIVLDGVFNHTGDDSLYFNKYGRYGDDGAFCNPNSKYRSWFKFTDYPNTYESWWGITTLPATDKNNLEYIDYITGKNGVIEKYTALGVGGWRLDVVDELPEHFVRAIRKAVKNVNPDAVIIGEVWEDASNKIAYGVRRKYFQGKELDSVMNYPLKNAILDFVTTGNVKTLSHTIKEQIDHYPKMVLDSLMNLLSTHDTFRLLSALSGVDATLMTKDEMVKCILDGVDLEKAIFKLKVATLLQFTLCGVPSIYYGDEIGMQGFKDPLNRGCFPWGNENQEILSWYKLLSSIRTNYSVFSDGEFVEEYSSNGVFAFKRFDKNAEVMIFINISDKTVYAEFNGTVKDLLTENVYSNNMEFSPNTFAVLVCEKYFEIS